VEAPGVSLPVVDRPGLSTTLARATDGDDLRQLADLLVELEPSTGEVASDLNGAVAALRLAANAADEGDRGAAGRATTRAAELLAPWLPVGPALGCE
jgi:hypothetical protein